MATTADQVTDDARPGAADDARRRLLAGLPVTERRLELAGVPTAVLEGGDGPPVVLLHGQGGWSGLWLPVAGGLARSHRVVAPDLPGLGASAVPDGPPDAARVLAWLGELIERTLASDVHVRGNEITVTGQPADNAFAVRVFDELIANRDRNIGNMLWTSTWKMWMIDHTRAFRRGAERTDAAR